MFCSNLGIFVVPANRHQKSATLYGPFLSYSMRDWLSNEGLLYYIEVDIQYQLTGMEDGKKRHLFQLQPKRQSVLKMFPDQGLNEYLDFMKSSIKGRKFPRNIFTCCFSKKYKRVNPDFADTFEELPQADKIHYYRKYLDVLETIGHKKSRLPETSNQLDDFAFRREQMQIRYRLSDGKKWRQIPAVLDTETKIIESADFKIDLHKAFVSHTRDENFKSKVFSVVPWRGHHRSMEIVRGSAQDVKIFQRIEIVSDLAIEENIVRMIDGEEPTYGQQNNNGTPSERSLKTRLMEDHPIPTIHAVKEVELVSYLNYKHPTTPLDPPVQPNRLISQSNIHYFLQGEYQVNKDGELVAINQQKLEAQSSVIKYIIKRVFSGGKLMNISLPVSVFSEQSNLSLLMSQIRHAPLQLQAASKQKDPLSRFLKVIRFALTGPPCYVRCDKPFNPLLGQTYQATVDGTLFYGQQVSHHPPISSLFVKGRGYTLYGSFQAEVKFGLNSASGNNKGWVKISFNQQNLHRNVVRFNHAPGEMGGLVLGSRTLCLKEAITFIDEQNLLFCRMTLGKIKYQKKVKEYADSVEGKIVRLKKGTNLQKHENINEKDYEEQIGLISGRWLSEVFFKGVLLINTLAQKVPQVERYPALLPSDYSLRGDIIHKRQGDEETSQTKKEELEEIQRKDRKLREQYRKTSK